MALVDAQSSRNSASDAVGPGGTTLSRRLGSWGGSRSQVRNEKREVVVAQDRIELSTP
jgi:hypothetical protein